MERSLSIKANQRGMTIIEVLFAMVILSIALTGALQALLTASALNQQSERIAAMNNILRDKTAEILHKAKEYTDSSPLVRDGEEYTNIDAMIRWYSDTANQTFSIDRNTFLPATAATIDADIVVGKVALFLDELQIPGNMGGSMSNPLANTITNVGPMDLDGVDDPAGTPDGLGHFYIDCAVPTGGRYLANIVPLEVSLEWKVGKTVQTERRTMQIGRTGL